MSWKKQQEDDIHQAKILNDLLKKMTKNFTNVNKQSMHMAEVFKNATEKTTQIKSKLRGDRSHERHLLKELSIQEEIMEKKLKGLKEDREEQGRQKESRNRNRLDEIRTQGENVRHNLKMRHLYKDQGQSLSNVMNLMTGMSGRGAVMGGISTAFNTLSLGSNILETNKNLKEAQTELDEFTTKGEKGFDGNKQEFKGQLEQFTDRVDRLTAILTEQREKLGMFGKFGGEGKEDSKWAQRLEPIMTWAKNNKSGIIISAASIGLLFMTFKKLLSVSPMLQKMLELMSLSFNLILRPFGDFIGFILMPIAIAMLATVMPFFKEAYKFLIKLGAGMGAKFVKGDILGGLGLMFEAISPFDVLRWIFGDREGNTEGGIGTVGAVLSAGLLGLFAAVIISLRKMTGWVRAFLGIKPVVVDTPRPSSTGGAPDDINWRDGKRPSPNNTVGRTEIIRSTIGDVFRTLKIGKFNTLASLRGGSGGTAFMVSQMLDHYAPFKEAKLDWFKWTRDVSGANDPSNAWKGIDQYGQGIGTPDYSQKHPFAHNVDSGGNVIINIENISSDMDLVKVTEEMSIIAQEFKLNNIGGDQ